MALYVARPRGRGSYFARKIIARERSWLRSRDIEEGRKGCYSKTKSWLNDEGVQLAVREWLARATEAVSSATIRRHYPYYMRIIDAYGSGATYGTKGFREQVYKAHRQIADMSKW